MGIRGREREFVSSLTSRVRNGKIFKIILGEEIWIPRLPWSNNIKITCSFSMYPEIENLVDIDPLYWNIMGYGPAEHNFVWKKITITGENDERPSWTA